MAAKFPAEGDEKVKLRTRKGHDMTWSCDIHGEPIAFYCKEHGLPICDRCAIKDHQKPCNLDNIGDVIFERRRKLDDKQQEIVEMKKQQKMLESKLESTATSANNHLQSVNDEVQVAFEDKLKIVKDKEKRLIRSIDEEADEEIQIINEKRERRIKSCHEEAEQQQSILKESQAKVESETKAISEVVAKKIKDLKNKSQHANSTMDNIDSKIKRIKQEDKKLVHETPQVLASIDEHLSLNVNQDVNDCLDRIQREVQKVKFVEGEVGGEHYRRIDGYIGKWELVKSIHISSVELPAVRGLISDDEISVGDETNDAMYVTNISTEHTQMVIGRGSNVHIASCAPIDSNVIVCGKGVRGSTGDSLDGCITLYDREWKVITDISIPMNSSFNTRVYVDVDRNGMILAAQYGQSNIYVINPADGQILNTITMQGKKVCGNIQALSSGDIVMNTGINKFTVISRSEEKAAIHSDEWCGSRCHVDKLTDTLYIAYWDTERTIYVVDQVSCDGIIQARRIVEYEESDRWSPLTSPCIVTPSGNLVACDGTSLLVYKKSFIV